MAAIELIKLVTVQFDTDKDVEDLKIEEGGKITNKNKVARIFSVDYSMKKAFGLLGLYIGIVNAEAPSIFFEIVRTFIGG